MDTNDKRVFFIEQTVKLYEKRIGHRLEKNRLRDNVEHRAALANALKPFATVVNIGRVLGRDHSSIVHYTKNHESYYRWSPEYRMYFYTAIECTRQVSDDLGQQPIRGSYITARSQLKNLNEIIRWSEEIKEKIIQSLEEREQEIYLCQAGSKQLRNEYLNA